MERSYPLEKTRNFGIIAHIDAGKTTTSERILFTQECRTRSARCTRARDDGLDGAGTRARHHHYLGGDHMFLDSDIRGATKRNREKIIVSISSTPRDTSTLPVEVKRSLRVLDGAVVVFDGVAGVEPQSETNWRYADDGNVPRICFINKLDRTGATFERSYRFDSRPLDQKRRANANPDGRRG